MVRSSSKGKGSVVLDLWHLSQLSARWLGNVLEGNVLSPDEFGFCSSLALAGDATSTELADTTGMPLSTLSSMTKRLEQRGLLTRRPHPHDRRAHIWLLTASGLTQLGASTAQFRQAFARLSTRIADETGIARSLGRVEDAFRVELSLPSRSFASAHADSQLGREAPSFSYAGEELTPQQVGEIRGYIDWIRHRARKEENGQ